MNTHTPLTVAAFQQHIRDRYYPTDKARGTPGTFMWFVEEVGELATALHESNKPDAAPPPEVRANLEEEFADVIAWLCTLANINEVDLAAALQRKYLDGKGPEGHK
ncbi:MAG: MazG nucleotide pyrophosphohydrolase domain-containing protein [Phycisphaerales bacterium]